MESKQALMVSPFSDHKHRRTAHFLPHSVTDPNAAAAAPAPTIDGAVNFLDSPVKPKFVAWKQVRPFWKIWVDQMLSSHRSTWEKAGILDAILSTTFNICRYNDLLLGFLEHWSSTTNTFAFPWGEATVTLEDTAVLGGFSVLGEWVMTPPENARTEEILEKLATARSEICKSKWGRADQGRWAAIFMGSQDEIEHAAFLAYWLSVFVFPSSHRILSKNVLPIAARLSTGTKIALAPAVLSAIYKSLSLWKKTVITDQNRGDEVGVVVSAPLWIVQVWIWERFPTLRPNSKSVNPNEPRLARWSNVKSKIPNLSSVINSAGKEFNWRPYQHGKLYKNTGYWVKVDSSLSNDLDEFIQWTRASTLLGLQPNCVELYLPHRVARQFGMDQDIPGHVAQDNFDSHVARTNYARPVVGTRVYVPACSSLPSCTSRYLKWWRNVNHGRTRTLGTDIDDESNAQGCELEDIEDTNDTNRKEVIGPELEDQDLSPPPGFSPKNSKRKWTPNGLPNRKKSCFYGPTEIKATVSEPPSVKSYNKETGTSYCPELEQVSDMMEYELVLAQLEERVSNLEKLCAQL